MPRRWMVVRVCTSRDRRRGKGFDQTCPSNSANRVNSISHRVGSTTIANLELSFMTLYMSHTVIEVRTVKSAQSIYGGRRHLDQVSVLVAACFHRCPVVSTACKRSLTLYINKPSYDTYVPGGWLYISSSHFSHRNSRSPLLHHDTHHGRSSTHL